MTARTSLAIALALGVVLILISLLARHRSASSKLNLDDLLLGDDGKFSKAAAVMLGSFALTSWLMVLLALRDKMTEGYLAIYVAAWITPVVTVLIKGRPTPEVPPQQSTGG